MHKTLAFLESLGRDARLARAPADELAAAARAAGVEAPLADALARRDHAAFSRLLSALLLSVGLTLPLAGYALVFSPSEEESPLKTEEEPEAEAPPANPPSPPKPEQGSGNPAPAGEAAPPAPAEGDAGGDPSGGAAPEEGSDVQSDTAAVDDGVGPSADTLGGEAEEEEEAADDSGDEDADREGEGSEEGEGEEWEDEDGESMR
jgi:hypothetical protein